MTEFVDHYHYKDKETAVLEVSFCVERIQQMYKEMMLIAAEWDVKVDVVFDVPDNIRMGHNQEPHIYWNPSSSHC